MRYALLAVVLCVSVLVSTAWSATTVLYDKNWRTQYYIRDGEIFDLNWSRTYYLKENRIYDLNWQLQYYLKDDTVYDLNWQLQYYLRERHTTEPQNK